MEGDREGVEGGYTCVFIGDRQTKSQKNSARQTNKDIGTAREMGTAELLLSERRR